MLAAERLGVHGVAPASGLTPMVAGVAALAWPSVAQTETVPLPVGHMKQNVTGGTILIPFTGGAEGREEVGYSKCHIGLELECPSKRDSVCWALPL